MSDKMRRFGFSIFKEPYFDENMKKRIRCNEEYVKMKISSQGLTDEIRHDILKSTYDNDPIENFIAPLPSFLDGFFYFRAKLNYILLQNRIIESELKAIEVDV